MNFLEEQHGNSPIHYSCEMNGVVIELYPVTTSFPLEKSVRLGFSIDSIENLKQKLNKHGIEIKERKISIVIEDPDGRTIFLTQKERTI